MGARQARVLLPTLAFSGLVGAAANAPPATSVLVEGFQEIIAESTRKGLVDARAEAAMAKYYPGALGSLTVDRIMAGVLGKRGYTPDNTLFATSTCPDEVNSKPGEMIDLIKNRFGENFALGGLGGVPFTGRAGFSAYAHHVPQNGKMFILVAPHVGVEFDGEIGKLKRVNQDDVSTACGAAVGAYKALMKGRVEAQMKNVDKKGAYGVQDGVSDYFDAQIDFIKLKLAARLNEVADAPDAQAYVSYQMYALVREFFIDELLTAPGFWDFADEVTVLGGIMINRGVGGDRFMPLMLQSRSQGDGSVVDMYKEAFGEPPTEQIEAILAGSDINVFDYQLSEVQRPDERTKP